MKNYFIILFIFFINNIQSQTRSIVVLDSLTNHPIPFVTIQFSKDNGTYTNEKGFFDLNQNSKDTLQLTHIAYNDFKIKASDVKATIILSPNAILLKDVKINNGKQITNFIDFAKKNNSISSWPISSNTELLTLIVPNIENANSNIIKLNFKFEKRKYNEISSLKTALRINIYDQKNEKIIDKIYSGNVHIIDASKKDYIDIDLNNENIELSKNGLFIGIEVIGDINESGDIIKDKSYIRPVLTGNSISDYSAKTFIRYTFKNDSMGKKLIPINEILAKTSDKKFERNLSFGMTLSKKK